MNRVKYNFIKQWIAAGLYNEQQTVSNGHRPNNPQIFAEPVVRHEEPMHMYHVGPTSSSAYLQHHDLARLDPSQHHQFSPYYNHTFRPLPLSYQLPYYSLHPVQSPGQHPHDLAPQYNHNSHMHSVDLMNGNSHNPWVNEANPGLMRSYQTSPGFSLIGHPREKIYLHQPSSSQLSPSRLQDGISSQGAGHLHLPHGESPSAFNKHHAVNSGRSAGDGSHHQHHQMDSVPTQTYPPSSSCMPAHKLNQTTSRHMQSSHIQGGRNIDYPENVPVLPPTESTPNYAKRGTGSLQHPLTNNTSCQQPNQINSSPEQSSSTDNIETCHPLEKTCQNQLGSSPSERLYSTTDYSTKFKRKRGRGPTRSPVLREGERIPVAINEQGQPVGHTSQKLVNYLGTLARNGEFLPLTYLNWRVVPLGNKEDMWQKIQSKFEIDPVSKDWLLQSIRLKWKSWKANLKNVHYYPHETDAERLADRDERVPPDQWADLIAFWNTETAKKLSATNRANRMNQKFYHASGNKSFARIREEQKSAGKELSRAELFIVTRTRKNGEPINIASAEVIKQLREREKGHDDTPQKSSKEGDILTEIMGPNKKGHARCIELGPSSSDLLKPSRGEAIKMVAQAKVEIREMKDKMSVMEQTCAQMASQMAAMMSMMSSMHSRNSPDNAPHMDANPAACSEHSIPQQVHTRPQQVHTRPPSSFTGSTRMTRSKREF